MRYASLCLLVLSGYLPLAAAEQDVRIDAPLSGWRENTGDNAHYSQQVNYPASSVNIAADQSETAKIRGQIANMPKQNTAPGRLVVNGISMPLKIESDGSFARPFIFSEGSNSVEVRSPDGTQTGRRQFYASQGAGAVSSRLRVVLSWDTDDTDLDLHVVTPDGEHAWYGKRNLDNGGALDIDVTTGYGPEMFATPTPLRGKYLVYVNYYGGRGEQELTTAHLSVITEEGTLNEKQETFVVPMRNPGELTLVKGFSY
ncbi:DUF2135 domain-containing protein [Enterobacillus tribolii]|uniref:Uncharacterized protein YfaP (DUF2135 family) n=1 Tax=Enterobacillus tribolii TaxID=1487935 RepID=A0A370Q6V5_9GAMM|nr:DUF2135 domain-containing protein [Enterobacillus tribolii]MBW7984890.1 DUF2135 domain-containing protein [Enterobacillus tribolii]RDK84102.1 uncharacterized protein YfaP (DUF2135 family) [Enterobacillus tribolii]